MNNKIGQLQTCPILLLGYSWKCGWRTFTYANLIQANIILTAPAAAF
jgi:hypothetical protein